MTTAHTRRLPSLLTLAAVVCLEALPASAAQESRGVPPNEVTCHTYPSSYPHQTIVVVLKNGDCVVDPYDGALGLPTLTTRAGSVASWDVCNKCGAAVDIRVSGAFPNSFTDLFGTCNLGALASNEVVATKLRTDQHPALTCRVASDLSASRNSYDVAVKFSSEGPGGWKEFDPELQIEEGSPLVPPAPPVAPGTPWLTFVLIALLAAVAGFFLSRLVMKPRRPVRR